MRTIPFLTVLAAAVSVALPASADPPAAEEAPTPGLNFDLLGDAGSPAPPKADPVLEQAVTKRRERLEMHQILGLSTLALMAGTAIVGQLNYSDLYGAGGGRTGHFLIAHRLASYATTAGFISTVTYALLAPTPYDKEHRGIDTTVLHKVAMIGASLGMATQIGLGFVAARKADAGNADGNARLAVAHQIVGYGTLTFMSMGAMVWVF